MSAARSDYMRRLFHEAMRIDPKLDNTISTTDSRLHNILKRKLGPGICRSPSLVSASPSAEDRNLCQYREVSRKFFPLVVSLSNVLLSLSMLGRWPFSAKEPTVGRLMQCRTPQGVIRKGLRMFPPAGGPVSMQVPPGGSQVGHNVFMTELLGHEPEGRKVFRPEH